MTEDDQLLRLHSAVGEVSDPDFGKTLSDFKEELVQLFAFFLGGEFAGHGAQYRQPLKRNLLRSALMK